MLFSFQLRIVTVLFLLFSAVAFGAEASTHMWRIERDNKTSYLLGTIHFGKSVSSLPTVVKDIIENSVQLFLESDVKKAANPPKELLHLPEEKSLKDLIPSEAWERLVQELHPEFDADQIQTMAPFLASTLLQSKRALSLDSEEVRKLSAKVSAGQMEMELYINNARETKQPLKYLEKFEDVQHFLQMTSEALAKSILMSKAEFEEALIKSLQGMVSLVDLYESGDIKAVEKMTDTSMSKEMKDKFLIQRNHLWLPVIEEAMVEGNVVFAVGMAHLYGEEGLIELLQAQGYTVQRVMADGSCEEFLKATSK